MRTRKRIIQLTMPFDPAEECWVQTPNEPRARRERRVRAQLELELDHPMCGVGSSPPVEMPHLDSPSAVA